MKCKYCGQSEIDGGLSFTGEFLCIDCIILNPAANSELAKMRPLPIEGLEYPPECYDVSKYKMEGRLL